MSTISHEGRDENVGVGFVSDVEDDTVCINVFPLSDDTKAGREYDGVMLMAKRDDHGRLLLMLNVGADASDAVVEFKFFGDENHSADIPRLVELNHAQLDEHFGAGNWG